MVWNKRLLRTAHCLVLNHMDALRVPQILFQGADGIMVLLAKEQINKN